jgi:aminoglycoside/choline kinase family phosphotransferase
MLPADETQITAPWLTGVLQETGTLTRGRVRSVTAQRIAEGVGLMARLSRLTLEYDGADAGAPKTLIAKQPIDLPQNLQIAQLYRFYEREGAFYRELAGQTTLRVPRCHGFVRDDAGGFLLLLEDLAGARLGDQIAGNRAEDALTAIAALAEHHARFWGKTQSMDFLVDFHAPEFCQILEISYGGALQPALDVYSNRFTPELAEIARALASKTTALLLRNTQRVLTVCHGDFRADNLFYDLPDGSSVAMIDWQISGRGFGFFDVAYHLTQSVASEVRRKIEREAIERYHQILTAHGIRDYSLADLWEEYREATLFALVYPITVCGALDLTNERARALGDIFLTRSLDAITDLRAGEKLP